MVYMNNTATAGNPIAEDGFGPGDTIRHNLVHIHNIAIGDTVVLPGRGYKVVTVDSIGTEYITFSNGDISGLGGVFDKVTHFLGNGLPL